MDGDDPEDTVLANLIVLAQGYESGGHGIVLDVFKEVIYEGSIRSDLSDGDGVESYFQELQDKFRRLEMVPIRGEMFEDVLEVDATLEGLSIESADSQQRQSSL